MSIGWGVVQWSDRGLMRYVLWSRWTMPCGPLPSHALRVVRLIIAITYLAASMRLTLCVGWV
jgi:hypothetical protein